MRRFLSVAAVVASVAVLAAMTLTGGSASAAAEPSGFPAGFAGQSMSWTSPEHGWAMGSAACGQSTCTTVVRTVDGGATWQTTGTIGAPLSLEDRSGVTVVRFADDLHGWAFDPSLWTTSDGGVTWTMQTTQGGRPLVALAAGPGVAYSVVSACRFNQPVSNCTHPTTLWKTTPGQRRWTQVSLSLPVANQAAVSVRGSVAYVVVAATLIDGAAAPRGDAAVDALDVTLDGQTWSSRPDPCHPADGETLREAVPMSQQRVVLLCQGDIGFGKAEKIALVSKDNGATTMGAGTMPQLGIETQLAATPSGTLVAASYSIGSWIYLNQRGQTWTTPVDLGDGGMGWNDVLFTTDQIGFVIHGPATCCGGFGPGELWETQDGGLTWGPV